MKSLKMMLWVLAATVGLGSLSGCVAVPPLVNVHHSDSGAKSRIDDLERRVQALEEKANQD